MEARIPTDRSARGLRSRLRPLDALTGNAGSARCHKGKAAAFSGALDLQNQRPRKHPSPPERGLSERGRLALARAPWRQKRDELIPLA